MNINNLVQVAIKDAIDIYFYKLNNLQVIFYF